MRDFFFFFFFFSPLFHLFPLFKGVYIPMLTAEILQNPSSLAYERLSGFAIGNPSFRCSLPPDTYFQTIYYHGLVSFASWQNWTDWNCSTQVSLSSECNYIYNDAVNAIGSQSEGLYVTGLVVFVPF